MKPRWAAWFKDLTVKPQKWELLVEGVDFQPVADEALALTKCRTGNLIVIKSGIHPNDLAGNAKPILCERQRSPVYAWTEEQNDILRRDYGKVKAPELAARIGCTKAQLDKQARKLGLTRTYRTQRA